VAKLLDPNLSERDDRAGWINDLAARDDYIRAAAHRLLAAEQTPAHLAVSTEQDLHDVQDLEAVVLGATLRIGLLNARVITVAVATTDHPCHTGWTTWHSDSPHLVGAVDGVTDLEITAALSIRRRYRRDRSVCHSPATRSGLRRSWTSPPEFRIPRRIGVTSRVVGLPHLPALVLAWCPFSRGSGPVDRPEVSRPRQGPAAMNPAHPPG
jgi:hypothetical protein